MYAGGASIGNAEGNTREEQSPLNGDWEGWHSYGGGGTARATDSWRIRLVYLSQIVASWRASAWAPWRSRRARMLRRRCTLSAYASSAPARSVFVVSSSTADWARARASATMRLQDRGGVAPRYEECVSDMCAHETGQHSAVIGVEERKNRARSVPVESWGREDVGTSDYKGHT